MIHDVPKEWEESLRLARAEAEHHTPDWCIVAIFLSLRGGMYSGWRWGGRFRVEVTATSRTRNKAPTVVRYWDGGIESFRKILDSAERRGLRKWAFADMVIYRFRHCGVPKEWGVEARSKIERVFGSGLSVLESPDAAAFAMQFLTEKLKESGYVESDNGDRWTNPVTGHSYYFDGESHDDQG